MDDVDKQLVIENTFAEEQEEEEEKKGDSVSIDVPASSIVAQVNSTGEKTKQDPALVEQANEDNIGMNIPGRSIIAQVNTTGEKPEGEFSQVKDSVGIEVPGRSVIARVDPTKQKTVDAPLPHDPYQVSGPLPPDPYQPAAPLYNPTPSTSLPPEGGGVKMKTTPLDDRSTAALLVCSAADDKEAETLGKEELRDKTQKEVGEQEEAETQEKEEQEAKSQEEEQEEARTQDKEEQEAKTQEEEQEKAPTQEKEEQKSKTQEEENEETHKGVDEQEEANITEREQETAGSPPTYGEATDNIPSTSKITPEEAKTAVKKVGGVNEFHFFFYHAEKDAKLPEGDYVCNGSCSCNCGKSCGKCVIGYQFNKIKVASLKEGTTTAAIQWNDKKHPSITLIIKVLMLLFYSSTLLSSFFTFLSKIYESTQKSQILFDVFSTFFSFVGTMVSAIALLVFLGRRCEETIQCWDRLLGCVKAFCTMDRIRLTCCCKECTCCTCCASLKDRMKGSRWCGCCSTKRNKRKILDTLEDSMKGSRWCGCCSTLLQRLSRGKWATILGNFCEMFLTVLDENLSTVIIVLSLYTFIGRQQYRVFYIITEWTEVTDIIKIIGSFLIFITSNINRAIQIAMNVHKFDKDIAKLPEKKLKRDCCQRFFGFQGRLVVHAILLSLLQIYCMLALAWKIIRDHCISEEEVQTTTQTIVINGTVFNSTPPTVFDYGPLRNCSVPSLQPATINGYTIYNIIYVTVLLPILSYLLLFVSNIPYFVEYSQLLHASGMYKFERAIEESEEEEVEKGVAPYPFLVIFAAFINIRNPKCEISEEDLKRKKDEIRQEREKVQKDIIYGVYKDINAKTNAICTSIPTVILGVIYFVLFYIHLGFLTCRYSPQLGVACLFAFDIFSVFTQSLATDVMVVFVPPVILIGLIGFPGPLVTMMWIGIILGIFSLVGSAFVLLIVFSCLVSMGNSSYRRY